jgi:hypothetical protein
VTLGVGLYELLEHLRSHNADIAHPPPQKPFYFRYKGIVLQNIERFKGVGWAISVLGAL